MLDLFIIHIDSKLSSKDYNLLVNNVSQEKRRKITRFHFDNDACNSLIGKIIIRIEICKKTGLRNNQLKFSMNDYGKMYLINDQHIHFNISHTGDYVVVAMDDEPVGVDVEKIMPFDLKIAERLFAYDEIVYIMSHTLELREKAFFEIWTKKESHIKWEGTGLSKPLPSFNVLNKSCVFPYYYPIFVSEEMVSHVCTLKQEPPVIRIIEIADILKSVSQNMSFKSAPK